LVTMDNNITTPNDSTSNPTIWLVTTTHQSSACPHRRWAFDMKPLCEANDLEPCRFADCPKPKTPVNDIPRRGI